MHNQRGEGLILWDEVSEGKSVNSEGLQLGLVSLLQHLGSTTVHSITACDELESKVLTEALGFRTSTRLRPGFDRVSLRSKGFRVRAWPFL